VRNEAIALFDGAHSVHQTRRNHRSFSDGFVQGFKIRQGFSTQILNKKETVKTFSADELSNLAAEYILAVSEAIETFGRKFVFNMDETPAPFLEIPKNTWGDRGKREKYAIKTIKRMKGMVTLMPTISASGRKLKLAWINAGKTRRAIDKMSLPSNVISFNSPKGWTNEDVMINYIEQVILNDTKGRECALILDDYAAHWTEEVQKAAKKGNIQLIKIPKGLTSILQPLDISFNSFFKQLRTSECSNDLIRRAGGVEDREKIIQRAEMLIIK
jgi:hypothetical protein